MARKLRLEFPGAIYHVLNRGNYRADVFEAREIRELRWAATLERCLRAFRRNEKTARTDRKGAPWKAAVALRMKEISLASNRRLSAQLHMGRPEAVSAHVGRLRRGQPQKSPDYRKLLAIV